MATPKLDLPADIGETISLLNATHTWNTSLVEHDGRIYLYDSDQLQFIAHTQQEAEAFLAGCFLATSNGKSVKQIRAEIASGRFKDKFGDDALDETSPG